MEKNYISTRGLREGYMNSAVNDFKTDILDNGDAYEVRAELAGFKRDEIEIMLTKNSLRIIACKKSEQQSEGEHYVHRERRRTRLSRAFAVSDIDIDKSTAQYEDGILRVILPKLSCQNCGESGRKIDIG